MDHWTEQEWEDMQEEDNQRYSQYMEENKQFVELFNKQASYVYANAKSKGFWDKDRNKGEMLMLMVCELAEGFEYLRKDNGPSDHIPEFSGIEEELADTIIRIMDMSAAHKLRVGEAILAKMAFNSTRPHMHEKKC